MDGARVTHHCSMLCAHSHLLIDDSLFEQIFGCVLCAVGSYALNSKVAELVGQTLPQGLIVVGAFLLILSFIGAASAWKEFRIGLGVVSGERAAREESGRASD